MSNRITERDLQGMCNRLNDVMGYAREPYGERTEDNRCNPSPNVYHIDHAYGGVMLAQMSSKPGCTGISCPLGQGHVPKKELYYQMHAYAVGLETNK